ncbi:MarR family winged helix-turn-helix transcriptional regulator [Coraliomargarita akajimensis]|uniref:Transcriptional regulator, MarR family n=1 Tax=Coraliomargarita akajimensis (strain DSM 45221 / IAM 15411 / JCM 23193 / KCTC 12865 / 04OKA010-24) TaxID=583355 RepID=D5EL81_CORAD|nr:MarR family transcriptional regulator [Coraliomargarita akajimensis]ADE53183.1 transcriptional regulator, MarR family [Coraliomargarita akajimensis DSM 45221]
MSDHILLKEPPRLECFLEAAKLFPSCDPSAMYAFTMLSHAHEMLWREKCAHYGECGITQGRFMIMLLLMDNECVDPTTEWFTARTPAELADKAQITRASVTGLIDSLEKDEYVRREPDPNDRRMVSVHLTEKGKAFMDGFLPPHFEMINQLMASLDEDERTVLVKLSEKLIEGVRSYKEAKQNPES